MFKPKKARNVRKRRHSSDSDNSDKEREDVISKLDDIKELQKMRGRQNGVSAASLALGKKIEKTEEVEDADPFKMKTGGFIDMKSLKKVPVTGEAAEAIGTAFAAETNRRDEDTEMLKYVEDELAKRKGRAVKSESKEDKNRAEDSLYQLPEHLKVKSATKRSEDMLSNQMLSGIPEIDLGIEAKIRNIEATEEAKDRLIREKMKKKENEVSAFVPTNMAVNFVQHNRFNIDDTAPVLKKVEQPTITPLRVGDVDSLNATHGTSSKSSQDEKATDDFHYEKFKKQMRRF
ncbi:splicing factor C9orf78 homolog [Haliotis asinina]|uniref:splicing factor C9orf78 homolog n=1 Tax=Haliotis asinina TaxID=109174 RepID=UPI003531CF65